MTTKTNRIRIPLCLHYIKFPGLVIFFSRIARPNPNKKAHSAHNLLTKLNRKPHHARGFGWINLLKMHILFYIFIFEHARQTACRRVNKYREEMNMNSSVPTLLNFQACHFSRTCSVTENEPWRKSPFCSQSSDEVKSKASPCQRLWIYNFIKTAYLFH